MSKSKYNPEEKTSIDPAFFDRSHQEPFKLSKFIHNKKDGTYFGRTTDSWGKEMDEKSNLAECRSISSDIIVLNHKEREREIGIRWTIQIEIEWLWTFFLAHYGFFQ